VVVVARLAAQDDVQPGTAALLGDADVVGIGGGAD